MHYYQFNIGDYTSHTARLSLMEDLAYRRLLDLYYLNERPLNGCSKTVAREIGMVEQHDSVDYILNKFFTKDGDSWVQKRADQEIKLYQHKKKAASRAGKASAKARQVKGSEQESNDRSTTVQPNIKHKPITNNQEPLTNTIGDESPRLPHCPHQDIVELYHRILTALPQVRVMTEARKRQLVSLWKQHPDLEWWRRYFDYCSKSDFLCGRADGKPGKPPFVADLEWITKPSNHAKIVEGKYHHQGAA